VRHFTQRFARRMGRRIEAIPAAIMDPLVSYSWPGNVRELQNVIERAVILSPGPALQVPLDDLQRDEERGMIYGGKRESSSSHPTFLIPHPSKTLADAEREHILSALRETGWVVAGPKGAAARLGMKRSTLQEKMGKLGIFRPSSALSPPKSRVRVPRIRL
jgi:formate hydrogenlyase transcriptional activator